MSIRLPLIVRRIRREYLHWKYTNQVFNNTFFRFILTMLGLVSFNGTACWEDGIDEGLLGVSCRYLQCEDHFHPTRQRMSRKS